jgi:hypothetical protein
MKSGLLMLARMIPAFLVSAALLAGMLLAGCSNEPLKNDEQPAKPPGVEESQKPAEPPAEGPSLPLKPYPKGDNGPWLPPLPQGLAQPGSLNEDEWEKVIELARTEPEVQRQIKKHNI